MENNGSNKREDINRENASHSTGPTSPQGKRRVSRNALRHGFLSKEVVLANGDFRETKTEYTRFRDLVFADLQPLGALELMTVDLIVLHYWRLRRVYRYETGALRFEVNKPAPPLRSKAIDYTLSLLQAIYDELEQNGFMRDEMHELLVDCYGLGEGSLASECSSLVREVVEDPTEPGTLRVVEGALPISIEEKQEMLEDLDVEMETLQGQLSDALDHERRNSEMREAMLNLPREEVAERVLRHGTAIERQLYRAIAELARLQRERREK